MILNDAQQTANNEPTFSATPYVVVGDSPSLTDIDSLNFTIDLMLQQANTELATQTAPEATPEATSDGGSLHRSTRWRTSRSSRR
ncbi:MAG: hypothetical protein U0521_14110 [Anaerolineae bacterium]